MSDYSFPSIELLEAPDPELERSQRACAERLRETMLALLEDTGVQAKLEMCAFTELAVIFQLRLKYGEPEKRLLDLRQDMELHFGCSVEMETIDKGLMAVAAKNTAGRRVTLRSLMESPDFRNSPSPLLIAAGRRVMGDSLLIDLKRIHHLLAAGTTGSGKSVFINDILLSLFCKAAPQQVRLILIDTKGVEFSAYDGLPHLFMPVVTDSEKAVRVLEWAAAEAESREKKLHDAGCTSPEEYTEHTGDPMPRIVIIADEYMELMFSARERTEEAIWKLCNAHRSGMHLILSTQSPRKEVITKKIKDCIPARASFTVIDKRESELVVHIGGAERLIGEGDMIYSEGKNQVIHAQAAYAPYETIDRVADYLRRQEIDGLPYISLADIYR